MPFIGNQPALSYTSFAKQDFTTSATTSYTLDYPVTNENEIALFINFVRQEPSTAYSASNTNLTLTSATSASDDMYCVFLGKAVQTVNPPNGSVGTTQIADDAVTTAKILDANITSAKLASGVLPTNTPAWCVRKSADQSIPTNTRTLITYDTEIVDTDSAFSSNTFTVPSGEGGKYFIFAYLRINSATNFENINSLVEVNSTMEMSAWGANDYYQTLLIQGILNLSAGDTVKHYGRQDSGGNLNVGATDQGINTMFGGYKLIGV